MTTNDQTLEGDPSEGGADLELELEVETPIVPSGDPLDAIQDETARAEAKKWRSIAQRKEKEPIVEKVVPVAPSSEFLTKADFYKSNERKAIQQATADAEIKANWAEIIPFYTSRHGKDTPEDILEDIKDAITVYKSRLPAKVEDDSADALSVTPAVKAGGGGSTKQEPKAKDPPNFKLPTQPENWYPKKS